MVKASILQCGTKRLACAFVLLIITACTPAWVTLLPPSQAVQTVYQEGVPHTDKMGRLRFDYDARRSFFPIGVYHALTGRHFARDYTFESLVNAGYNTVHTWEGQRLDAVIGAVRAHGLQLIYHNPTDAEVAAHAADPNLLAWYLEEEPTGLQPSSEMARLVSAFKKRREEIKKTDSIHPVIAIDGPPKSGREEDWLAWAGIGDVSSHFHYPLAREKVRSLDGVHNIPRSVSLAVAANRQRKPLWFVVQAFQGPDYGWYMPDTRELRAMTYSALIHGATGIIYFGFDSFVMRDGNVLGMAPEPLSDYGPTPDFNNSDTPPMIAKDDDLRASRALWREAARINAELRTLTPALLSPTSRHPVQVSVTGDAFSDAPIRVMLKEVEGRLILLAVNIDDTPLDVEFHFSGPVRGVKALFAEPHKPTLTDRGWRDTFAGFATRAYELRLADLPFRKPGS